MVLYSDLNSEAKVEKPLLKDVESVYQSIENILSTEIGERFFLPEFGADLESLLFEPIDDVTAFSVYDAVMEAVERWEPRVILLESQCEVIPYPDDNMYEVTLVFKIKGLEDKVFEFRKVLKR